MRDLTGARDAVTMDRRGFLIGGGKVLLILPAGWALAACTSNESSTTVPPATNVATGTLTFTSSLVESHNHMFTMTMQEVNVPPAVGISRDTSVTLAHTHIVTLTAAQLAQIRAGAVVVRLKPCSPDGSHWGRPLPAGSKPHRAQG